MHTRPSFAVVPLRSNGDLKMVQNNTFRTSSTLYATILKVRDHLTCGHSLPTAAEILIRSSSYFGHPYGGFKRHLYILATAWLSYTPR